MYFFYDFYNSCSNEAMIFLLVWIDTSLPDWFINNFCVGDWSTYLYFCWFFWKFGGRQSSFFNRCTSPSNSVILKFNFLMTPLEKCDLLASSSSTSLWISSYCFKEATLFSSSSFLKISFSVCFDWYSSSDVNWWFCSIVNRVVVYNCSLLSETRFFSISLIFWFISSLILSVAWTFSLSLSAISRNLLAFSISILYLNYCLSWSISSLSFI